MLKIELPKPYTAQLPVLKACFDAETFYVVLNGSRQVGKTFLCTVSAVKWALSARNQVVMLVSPTDSQVKKIYKQMVKMLGPLMFFIEDFKSQSGDSEISFKNGSVILFRSAASEQSLRGYSPNYMILDECAFFKEMVWTEVLGPSLSAKGKKVLFCSTPKGNNFFAKEYDKGIVHSRRHKSFKLTYHNNPYANLEFIEEMKRSIIDELFRQEYLGEFIDSAGCFRNVSDIAVLKRLLGPRPGDSYYVGVDIALKSDYTVAVVLDQNFNMVDYIRFNQTDTTIVIQKLKDFFIKWKPKKIAIESNNQGLPIIQLLRGSGVQNIEEFHTDGNSKPKIINHLISSCNLKEIKLIDDVIVKSEFNAFILTVTKTGSYKFAAAFGHDDIVMATAIAKECATRNKFYKAFSF